MGFDRPEAAPELERALKGWGAVVAYRWAALLPPPNEKDRARMSDGKYSPNLREWKLVRDWRASERFQEWPGCMIESDQRASRSHPSSPDSLVISYTQAVTAVESASPTVQQLLTWLYPVWILRSEVVTEYETQPDGTVIPRTVDVGLTTIDGYVENRWGRLGRGNRAELRRASLSRSYWHQVCQFFNEQAPNFPGKAA